MLDLATERTIIKLEMSKFRLFLSLLYFYGAPWLFVYSDERHCPGIRNLTNFNESKILGIWYPVRHQPGGIENYVCRRSNFSVDDEDKMTLLDFGIDAINGRAASQLQNLRLYDRFTPNVYEVTYPGYKKPDLYISGTDYDSYLVAYRCRYDAGLNRFHDIMIYARKPDVTDSNIRKAFSIARHASSKEKSFMKLNHTSCKMLEILSKQL